MEPVLRVSGLVLWSGSAPINWSLPKGKTVALMGRTGSGKSAFLRAIAGANTSKSGCIKANSAPILAAPPSRADATPHSIALREFGRGKPSAVADALTHTGLWEQRKTPYSKLTQSQRAAAQLIGVCNGRTAIGLIDGQLDLLDPWLRAVFIRESDERAAAGASFIIATNSAEIAEQMDITLVIRSGSLAWAGSKAELLGRVKPSLLVETSEPDATVALVEPFVVSAEIVPGGVILVAEDDQNLAARLLSLGYGTVRIVQLVRPTFADCIEALS